MGPVAARLYLGFYDLEFDEALLRQGKLALSAASGCLPDGTFFAFSQPQHGPAPLDLPASVDRSKVVLAIPARRNGREAVAFQESQDSLARYLAWEAEVEDDNARPWAAPRCSSANCVCG